MEALTVGGILSIIYLIIETLARSSLLPSSWTWLRYPAVWVFLAGALGHVLLEYLGLNQEFCRLAFA